ncbi:hypothetical protein V2J09_007935 [Rumex salicifolius]
MLDKEARNQLLDFLIGLNAEFDSVRETILSTDPLPTMNKAYYKRQYLQQFLQPRDGSSSRKTKYDRICEHCHVKGHSKVKCYKLIRYPANWRSKDSFESWKGKHKGANATMQDNPLEQPASSSSFFVDPVAMSMMCQELAKFMHGHDTSTSNFAVSYRGGIAIWIFDTGDTNHMVYDSSLLSETRALDRSVQVVLPDGSLKNVIEAGFVILASGYTIHDVLLILEFTHNLLSVIKLLDDKELVGHLDPNFIIFQDRITKKEMVRGDRAGDLFLMTSEGRMVTVDSTSKDSQVLFRTFHERLGHCSLGKMKHVELPIKTSDILDCDNCILAKQCQDSFPRSKSLARLPFDLIHLDVWGPYKTPTYDNASYFLTILDDCTRYTWIYLFRYKSQVKDIIKSFLAYVHTQFAAKIKRVRSDNGTEFVQTSCQELFVANGIVHDRSIPGNPQQNGSVDDLEAKYFFSCRDVVFQEGCFPFKLKNTLSIYHLCLLSIPLIMFLSLMILLKLCRILTLIEILLPLYPLLTHI